MTNEKREYQQAAAKLAKLESRHADLEAKTNESKQALEDERALFGRELASGDSSVDKLADQLAKKQAKAAVYDAALQELSEQIDEQAAAVEQAQARLTAEEKAEASRQIRVAGVKLIKKFASLQIDIAKLFEEQRGRDLHLVDWNEVAMRLEEAQDAIERDPKIREKSKVPNAMRRGGWIDEKHTVPTLGSKVRDWAREEATK